MKTIFVACVVGFIIIFLGVMSFLIPPPHEDYSRSNTPLSIVEVSTSTPPVSATTTIPTSPSTSDYKKVTTTVFWVGEVADASNDFIANNASAWSSNWQTQYGGIDDPNTRCGLLPCTFTPKENPFYFALPYNDLTEDGVRKESANKIPWFSETYDNGSVVKNRWIEIRYKGRTCYGQWEDTGPNEDDDFAYVFGTSTPKNTFGLKAGLDVSPALRDCLRLSGNNITEWRFINQKSVPPGPWSDTVTTSDVEH